MIAAAVTLSLLILVGGGGAVLLAVLDALRAANKRRVDVHVARALDVALVEERAANLTQPAPAVEPAQLYDQAADADTWQRRERQVTS